MKTIQKLLLLFTFFILQLMTMACNKESDQISVITLNIRFNNPGDGINRWSSRLPLVDTYLNETSADLIGMQEVQHNQLLDLRVILPEFAYVGRGRDDGKMAGEYSPIFYRKNTFELLDNAQFWLSETPDVPGSISWDAAITRIVTWAKLKHIRSGQIVFCFNTHFDHRGVEARKESINLMASMILKIAGSYPVIAMGDFNIRKDHDALGNTLYDQLFHTFLEKCGLINSEYITSDPVESGRGTFNAFDPNWKELPPYPIDFIFASEFLRVKAYRIDEITDGDVFISDHWPVVSVIELTEK